MAVRVERIESVSRTIVEPLDEVRRLGSHLNIAADIFKHNVRALTISAISAPCGSIMIEKTFSIICSSF